MPRLPAPPESPFSKSVAALAFSMADHKVLCAFRNRLRRKAIWAVITPLHRELAEALEVYRPYEAPEKAEPTWTIWRSAAGVWVLDKDCGPLGEPTTLTEAVEIVEAVLKIEMHNAVRAIPKACPPELPRKFCSNTDGA